MSYVIVGGPNRPQKIVKESNPDAPSGTSQAQAWAESARGIAEMGNKFGGDLYGRMTGAMNERG